MQQKGNYSHERRDDEAEISIASEKTRGTEPGKGKADRRSLLPHRIYVQDYG